MVKKIFIGLVSLCMLFIMPNLVMAKEIYTNSKGVSIDKKYYEKLCSIYSKDYIEFIENDDLQEILSNGLDNIVVKVISDSDELNINRGSIHTTASKIFKIAKSGNLITVLVIWKTEPKIKTYDVIGVRFGNGVSLKGNITFKQTYQDSAGNKKEITKHYDRILSNGFGSSFKVSDGTKHEISISFKHSGSGTIYGSYQHTKHSTTLTESKNYTLSSSGLGRVVNFDSSVKDKYDGMGGVDLKV